MVTIIITGIINILLALLAALFIRKKTRAETESLVVQQFKILVDELRREIAENKEEIKHLKESYGTLKKAHDDCEYDHLVKTLELAQLKKIVDINNLPKETVFVLDDNKLVTMEFKKYFSKVSVLDCRTFLSPDEFLKAARNEKPGMVVLDYVLSDVLTADDVIKELGYTPEIFIMSQDKGIQVRIRAQGYDFFYKDDNYVQKIAAAIIEHLYHKT